MIGRYVNGKIQYHTPRYNALSGGNWSTGWSRISKTGGDLIEYEVVSEIELKEGETYQFTVIENKAHIKNKKNG